MEHPNQALDSTHPDFFTALRVWIKIGLLSFGGPAAQIALMHKLVVEEKNWLSEKQYLNALNFCMLLPGPEAMQLASYAGWRMHGVRGGLAAGLSFVLPGALVILILAGVYSVYGDISIINALFLGIKAAVIVVVVEALLRVAKRALVKTEHWLIAAFAFVGIFFFNLPYPLIVVAAAALGFTRSRSDQSAYQTIAKPAMLGATLKTVITWLAIWVIPFVLLYALGDQQFLLKLGAFFSKLAVVTFGGAYAVLAYLAQDVVTQFGWLTADEMMDGLGLAETTPGPLILVTEFVGFIAGFREGGIALGITAALITLWVTFVPCFLWIFAGAPYIEWISAQPRLKGALSAITAAVVGVILNLSVWFALHVLFASVTATKMGPLSLWIPEWSTLDWRVLLLVVGCAIALLRLHWSLMVVLAMSAMAGLALQLPSL
ncbi:MAG: chromate efflux transporter [Granulosicoccaceae bacterium]